MPGTGRRLAPLALRRNTPGSPPRLGSLDSLNSLPRPGLTRVPDRPGSRTRILGSTYLCPDREPEQVEDSTGLASERPDDGHDRAGHFTGNQDVTKGVLMVG